MKISLNWIADYVALPAGLSPTDIAHQLTMSTVEVEGVHDIAGDVILEIDNKSLTNRPDLWGHYGVARELEHFGVEAVRGSSRLAQPIAPTPTTTATQSPRTPARS